MYLTDFSDYSLRVLTHLNQSGEQATLAQLADSLKIPRNHLIKISNKLVKLGYVDSTRGPHGGLRIRKDAGRARLGSILLATEERIRLAECFNEGKAQCTLKRSCILKGYLNDALGAFVSSLNQRTLDDITPKKPL